MDKIIKKLFSMKVAIVFLFLFAIASGVATFIENDFGVAASWSAVYTSKWFEFIQIVLACTIIVNIFVYKLYRLEKLPALTFHVGFLVILLGSAITRYAGYEGSIHIREGMSENRVISSDVFVNIQAKKDGKTYENKEKELFSSFGSNAFSLDLHVKDKVATVKYKNFINNASYEIVSDKDGQPMIEMMISDNGETTKAILKLGDTQKTSNGIFTFFNNEQKTDKQDIQFFIQDKKIYLLATQDISWFKMVENTRGVYPANKPIEFVKGQLYTIGGISFAPKFIGLQGKEKLVEHDGKSTNNFSAVVVNLSYNNETKNVELLGRGRGTPGVLSNVVVGGQKFTLSWGSEIFTLPFSIKLNDFQLDRYPGSRSPMSYASEVEVIDHQKNLTMHFRIYMNHVLDYDGFRFFQSSYDPDEKGTILSVNSDPGKWPTYIGYILLSLGMFFNLLNPKSRFRKLSAAIQKDMKKMKSLFIMIALSLSSIGLTPLHADATTDLAYLKHYDKNHAQKFGEILVQSMDGRIKPIDTVANEVLNKVYRKTSYKGLSADQVILGMMTYPQGWQTQKMIKVFHPELKKILGLEKNDKYASFNDFFEKSGNFAYKLAKYAEEANRKRPALRNKFDKDVIKVDERVNIVYMVYTGDIFRMIPKIGDENYTWYSPKVALSKFPLEESEYIRKILGGYFDSVAQGLKSGNWTKADNMIEKIKDYQELYGKEIMPSPSRIQAELFFNKAKIFQRLTPLYLLSGLLLLAFIFAKMMKPNLKIEKITKIMYWINIAAFSVHTLGLILRWYIAEHAPWSDGYESMIYIAWAIALSGIFFSKQSIVSLALTSILAGVTLFVAHLSWMDPQITTLVPVLKSYWLNIHVSVITASYGFLGLCALLGFFTLILFIIRSGKDTKGKKNQEIERNIVEATRINEMAMILGLSLLTVGNFLGGVWANESWGRYWGWDPKETWALVSILIYAVVLHLRFIPSLNNQFAFAVASVISFSSILMTYFGVNFYLSGMHSYAAGDPVPIPMFVYYTAIVVLAVIALAYPKRHLSKTL